MSAIDSFDCKKFPKLIVANERKAKKLHFMVWFLWLSTLWLSIRHWSKFLKQIFSFTFENSFDIIKALRNGETMFPFLMTMIL